MELSFCLKQYLGVLLDGWTTNGGFVPSEESVAVCCGKKELNWKAKLSTYWFTYIQASETSFLHWVSGLSLIQELCQIRAAAPLDWKESAKVVWVACLLPPLGGVSGMFHWKNSQEASCTLSGLLMTQDLPRGAGKGYWGMGYLGFSLGPIASVAWFWKKKGLEAQSPLFQPAI